LSYLRTESTYSAPVITPEELLQDYPGLPTTAPQHFLTVKAFGKPELVSRALASVADYAPAYVETLVVDDSVTETDRAKNRRVAESFGAEYYPVKGERSIVANFSRFLELHGKNELAAYLGRVATSYPRQPGAEFWGGVGGAQNVSHLVNIMKYGERSTQPEQWLSSFIDQDVIIPPDARNIAFPLISMYRNLGVGMLASAYVHHVGSPTGLSAKALSHLVDKGDSLTQEETKQEVRNIMARAPTVGLQSAEDSLSRYTSSAPRNFDFPSGNYTLCGEEGFTRVPVSIMGHEDQGFGAMLQVVVGAKEMGVARVPGFTHIRKADTSNAAHGSLIDYLTRIGPRIKREQTAFLDTLLGLAETHGIPQERIAGLSELQASRLKSQSKALTAMITSCEELLLRPQFQLAADELLTIREAAHLFAVRRSDQASPADLEFATHFLSKAIRLQPLLAEEAYAFGEAGMLQDARTD